MNAADHRPFLLTKWYLDCVGDDGRVAIAYWSAIAWRGITICWHSLSLREADAEPIHRTSLAPVAAPAMTDSAITWHTAPLGCRFECHPILPGVGQRLLDTPDGSVDWRCETTAGQMKVVCDGQPEWRGLGYIERLDMSLAPWRLPIDQLRWGRWIATDGSGSLVWIDWRGPHPLTSIFLDGLAQQEGLVGDDRIETAGSVLTLTERETLYVRSLSETLGTLRPLLAPVLPREWLTLDDRKWRSRGTLRAAGRPDASGWVIHETLKWPS
jgi:hypothetical protein